MSAEKEQELISQIEETRGRNTRQATYVEESPRTLETKGKKQFLKITSFIFVYIIDISELWTLILVYRLRLSYTLLIMATLRNQNNDVRTFHHYPKCFVLFYFKGYTCTWCACARACAWKFTSQHGNSILAHEFSNKCRELIITVSLN